MNFYEKKIRYLDYLERGNKIKNGGFLKVEARDRECRVQLNIRGLYPTDTLQGEICIHSGGREHKADTVMLRFGTGTYVAVWDTDNIAGRGVTYDNWDGISVKISEHRILENIWNPHSGTEQALSAPDTDVSAITLPERPAAALRKEIPAGTAPEETQATGGRFLPEEIRAVDGTVLPEETQATGGRFLPEETRAVDGTVLGEEARAIDGTVLGEEARAVDGTVLPEETQATGGRFLPEETKAVDGTVLPEEAQATGGTFLPEEARAVDGTVLPEETQAMGGTFLTEKTQAVDGAFLGEETKAVDGTVLGEETQGGQKTDAPGETKEPEGAKRRGEGAQIGEETGKAREARGLIGERGPEEAAPPEAEGAERLEAFGAADAGKAEQPGTEFAAPGQARTFRPDFRTPESAGEKANFTAGTSPAQDKRVCPRKTNPGPDKAGTGRKPESGPQPVPQLYDDKWKQLQQIYKKVYPFGDSRGYLSIAPRDFVILPRKYQGLVSNSFLLHGYYNYGHILLGRTEDREDGVYYLGVPGIYHERERQVALMFGFEGFEGASSPCPQGSFGYYMYRVEI